MWSCWTEIWLFLKQADYSIEGINLNNKTVIELGLFDDEAELLKKELENTGCSLTVADCVSDLIALPADRVVIRTEYYGIEELGLFFDCYEEVGDFTEKIAVIGEIEVPAGIADKISIFKSFDDFLIQINGALK